MKYLAIVTLMVAGLYVAGCSNTADGFGRDMEQAGQKIQETF